MSQEWSFSKYTVDLSFHSCLKSSNGLLLELKKKKKSSLELARLSCSHPCLPHQLFPCSAPSHSVSLLLSSAQTPVLVSAVRFWCQGALRTRDGFPRKPFPSPSWSWSAPIVRCHLCTPPFSFVCSTPSQLYEIITCLLSAFSTRI